MDKTFNSIKFPELQNTYRIPQQADEYSSTKDYIIGEYVTQNGHLYRCLESITAGDWNSEYWTEVDATSEIRRIATYRSQITLLADSWSEEDPFYQEVTIDEVEITENSKVDLQPSASLLSQLINLGVSGMIAENNNGTIKVYFLGTVPDEDINMQCTVTEVLFNQPVTD